MAQGDEEPDGPAQGWFVDPFGSHDHRWFSQGTATSLVRDGTLEAQDPPPDGPVPGPLVPIAKVRPPAGATATTPGTSEVRSEQKDSSVGVPVPREITPSARVVTGSRRPLSRTLLGRVRPPVDVIAVTPTRILRARWVALVAAVVWTVLVSLVFLSYTTKQTTGGTHAHTETVRAADPAAVLLLGVALLVACAVTGAGLVRRIRTKSQAWSRPGAVCAGIVGVCGILSLATVGLALVVAAVLLLIVARPIRPPRPMPGERLPGAS